MDTQDYFYRQLTLFNYHLHSDYGLFIKVTTCIAFGAICGWIIGLLTLMLYKVVEYLDCLPVTPYKYQDDDLDLESDFGYNQQGVSVAGLAHPHRD